MEEGTERFLQSVCSPPAPSPPSPVRVFAAGACPYPRPPPPAFVAFSWERGLSLCVVAWEQIQGKMSEHLFEDTFIVTRLDPDGKKFDKVSRVEARSEQLDMYMQLDVATDVYPVCAGEKFNMVLAPTLNLDGTPDTGYYTQAGRKTLADNYEYVMQGKLYKISEDTSSQNAKVEIYASFSGLLMLLRGDPSTAASFELDQRLFLLMRKV